MGFTGKFRVKISFMCFNSIHPIFSIGSRKKSLFNKVAGPISPEENCPRKITLRIIAPRMTVPWIIGPRTTFPEGYLPPSKIAFRTIVSSHNCTTENFPQRKLAHKNISPQNDCPHSRNFPRTSTTNELKRTMHGLLVQ